MQGLFILLAFKGFLTRKYSSIFLFGSVRKEKSGLKELTSISSQRPDKAITYKSIRCVLCVE